MKSLVYKIKFIFSHPFKILGKTLEIGLAIVGSFVTLFQILDSIYKNECHFNFLINNAIWYLIGISLFVGLLLSVNWIPKKTYQISGTDCSVTIRVGDISRYKKSIILSTNTSFVTTMANDIISLTSAQGCFQRKYFNNDLSKLDKLIANALPTNKKKKETLKLDYIDTKFPVYEVGTVAKIRHKNRNVYFLALNDINCSGQNTTYYTNDFYTSLASLWQFVKQHGNVEEAAIHLIGSGHAGLCEITKEESLKEIISSYIGQCQNSKIFSHLTVYIYPTDLKFIEINKVEKFIESKCLLANDNRKGREEK